MLLNTNEVIMKKVKRKRYKYRINIYSQWSTMLLTEEGVERMKKDGCEFWIGSQSSFIDSYGRIKDKE